MSAVADLQLPAFDHTDQSMSGERFHAAMAELRAHGWLAQTPYGYMVLDREAGEFFLRTRSAIFPGMKIAEIFGVRNGPLFEEMKRNILHINGPDHSRLRGLVNPALSPRAVERYRPAMQGFLRQLFDRCLAGRPGGSRSADAVTCEFVEAFAKPYPSLVIAEVMGAPHEDAPRLHHWSNWIQRQFDAGSMASERDGIEQAVEEFYDYAEALVRARRDSPGDDLVSKLIAAEEIDSDPPRLSDVECINLVFNVLVGGVDTSQSQLAHAVRLLAEHPDQWQALTQDPGLAEAAVEEALRYEPITPFTARILVEDITYRDVTFPEGTIVMVCAFTGNRDLDGGEVEAGETEAQEAEAGANGSKAAAAPLVTDPERFDITADRGRARPLTFGAGVHYCLGANLARLEMQEALAFLAEHIKDLELDGEPDFGTVSGIYGLERLPIRFTT
jgi:cytochrome P450